MPAIALFLVSLRQALPLRRTIALGLLQIGPAAVYLFATQSRTESAAFQGAVEIGAATFFALVLPITAIVISAGALGNERRDMTLSFIALRPMARSVIATAKTLAPIVASIALTCIGALLIGGLHAVRFGDPSLIPGLIAGTIVANIAYGSIYVPLGFLTDRAVIIGIGLLLVFENGIAFALTGLAFLSPWRLGVSVLASASDEIAVHLDGAAAPYGAGDAVLYTAVYLVLSLAVTTMLLRTRDLA